MHVSALQISGCFRKFKAEAVGGRTHLLSGDDVQVRVGAVEREVGVDGDSTADVDSLVHRRVRLALDSNLKQKNTVLTHNASKNTLT